MAFCGKCGQKNPDGAAFCHACGAKLQVMETPAAANAHRENEQPREKVTPRETPQKRERVILHKEGTPPPRIDNPQPTPGENAWQKRMANRTTGTSGREQPQQPRYEERQSRYEQPQQPRYDERQPRYEERQSRYEQPRQPRYDERQPRYEERQPRYEQPQQPLHSSNRGFEKPAKKGGTMGGCLKKLLLWIVGLIVVIGGVLYAIGTWFGDSEGGGGEGKKENPVKSERVEKKGAGLLDKDYERICTDEEYARLREVQDFPSTTLDVSLQPGTYKCEVENGGQTAIVNLKVENYTGKNKKIVGKCEMIGEIRGQSTSQRESLVLTYAGPSVYLMFANEDAVANQGGNSVMFVSPDGNTLELYNHGAPVLTLKKQ